MSREETLMVSIEKDALCGEVACYDRKGGGVSMLEVGKETRVPSVSETPALARPRTWEGGGRMKRGYLSRKHVHPSDD